MKFIVAVLVFGFGYAVFYWGLDYFYQYNPNSPGNTDAIPFSVLLGKIPNPTPGPTPPPGSGQAQGFDPSIYAQPPFADW